MKTAPETIVKDLVLVGGGHSHVAVLKSFGMRPLPGVRLTLIARDVHTPYSGMLPGFIAGHYAYDEAHVDLGPLSQFAGARLIHDEAVQIDPINKHVVCRGRPAVPYDVLSINIGSRPEIDSVDGAEQFAVPVKPINRFVSAWDALTSRVIDTPGMRNIGVVGAGAAGVELILCAQLRLQRLLEERGRSSEDLRFCLISKSARILPSFAAGVSRRFDRILEERGITVFRNCQAAQLSSGQLKLSDGQSLLLDEVLWVTAAGAPGWLKDSGLDVDPQGFISVRNTLATTSYDDIFAAGDIANVLGHPREKAGVIAVRQGPPLANNLRRVLLGRAAKPFSPQRTMLALIGTGDKYAIAAKGPWHAEGAWLWRWKEWIDRRWMAKYNELPEMASDPTTIHPAAVGDERALDALKASVMRCGGCGSKVASGILGRVLGDLRPVDRDDVLIGLRDSDDAAIVEVPPGKVLVQTVDYFRAVVNDPYVFGQIAANHALSDIFAMGAEPQSAMAIATIPYGLESKVETTAGDLMQGALKVLNDANTALVGGHTGEGAELALGFAVSGLIDKDSALRKGGMRVGDKLILTKPVGTGTLFAADMRQRAKGRWITAAIDCMLQSNQLAARCLISSGATACTDVTGFGVAGHLLEMLRASDVDARVDLDALPVLEGALESIANEIFSSLQPANLRLRRQIRDLESCQNHPKFPLLFDPQTSGGLLASVPADATHQCLDQLRANGAGSACVIGEITTRQNESAFIHIK